MITLGIETSGRLGSVALLRDGELIGERDLSRDGRRHARTLLAEIRDLLRSADLQPADVNTIAVSIGPGSFTGLRIGVTCAKTWAYATGATVIAVDTFLAIAEQSQMSPPQVTVISDAQRGDLFFGRYDRQSDGTFQLVHPIEIVSVTEFLSALQPLVGLTGPAVEPLRDQLMGRCQIESADALFPQAPSVARIGERLSHRDESSDIWGLEPLYLRKSAAEEKAERSK